MPTSVVRCKYKCKNCGLPITKIGKKMRSPEDNPAFIGSWVHAVKPKGFIGTYPNAGRFFGCSMYRSDVIGMAKPEEQKNDAI
jgi:hypothetical protein